MYIRSPLQYQNVKNLADLLNFFSILPLIKALIIHCTVSREKFFLAKTLQEISREKFNARNPIQEIQFKKWEKNCQNKEQIQNFLNIFSFFYWNFGEFIKKKLEFPSIISRDKSAKIFIALFLFAKAPFFLVFCRMQKFGNHIF